MTNNHDRERDPELNNFKGKKRVVQISRKLQSSESRQDSEDHFSEAKRECADKKSPALSSALVFSLTLANFRNPSPIAIQPKKDVYEESKNQSSSLSLGLGLTSQFQSRRLISNGIGAMNLTAEN